MINIDLINHRDFFPADSDEQKLFLLLKIKPTKEVSASRPTTAFSFVIDTSGSMDESVTGGKTKRSIVIESLLEIVRSGRLTADDQVSLIQFDDRASTLIELTPADRTADLEKAVRALDNYSGGTRLALGMTKALGLLAEPEMTGKRALIFTDGDTVDEWDCRQLAEKFATTGIPITVIGVGDEYNEDLLLEISDKTGGHPHHINRQNITTLPATLFEEVDRTQQEVINNIALTVGTARGVNLVRLTRVYPDQADLDIGQDTLPLGAAIANDDTIFILEFNLDPRPVSRIRIARLGLTYDVPGLNKRGEIPPRDVVLQFIAGGVSPVNEEVMNYVQQRNVAQMVIDATKISDRDPEKAEKLLEAAKKMTVKIGNDEMSEFLAHGLDELRKTRKISSNTRKTVKMGAKGKTVKMADDELDKLSETDLREISGT